MTTNGVISNAVKKLNKFFYTQQNNCGTSCSLLKCCKWDVTQLMIVSPRDVKYAILILNRPITQSQEFMKDIWNNATVRLTIDGGTGQWHKFVSKLPIAIQKSMKLPDLITGDFDSIIEDIMQKYKKQGCKTVHTPDQNYTDFTKALMELNKYCKEEKLEVDHVIAVGQSSGRIDHIIGNIQTLFLVREQELLKPSLKTYLLADDSISWLLSPGHHVIKIPEESRKHKRSWCSLIPIGEECQSVVSTGLKWNLDNQTLKFGELVSTSNILDGSEYVTIKCSNTLLWSMQVPSLVGPLFVLSGRGASVQY